MNSFAAKLVQNPVFSTLKSSDQAHLVQQSIFRNYEKDEWIVHYGDIWPYLFIVEEGTVTALKESNEGRSLIVATINKGEIFWGLAFFEDEAPMPVALVASEASRIHLWSRDRLLPLLLENGRMSWELSRHMVNRMQRASEIVEDLAFQHVTGRLARLLLEHFGEAVGEIVTRDMTLDEMAARIGTTREMVCRQLYKFADDGTIQINHTEFMIADQKRLEKIAGKIKG
ncbi:MAG: Crp/Fnr family transcriptional regulator [Anaerolineales bacterium]|nr:Crp/Fnr family transcriptional regulator [Anaerolineales bacterium]